LSLFVEKTVSKEAVDSRSSWKHDNGCMRLMKNNVRVWRRDNDAFVVSILISMIINLVVGISICVLYYMIELMSIFGILSFESLNNNIHNLMKKISLLCRWAMNSIARAAAKNHVTESPLSDLIDYDQLALTISLKLEKLHKNKLGLAQ